jgi:hypothetical protein
MEAFESFLELFIEKSVVRNKQFCLFLQKKVYNNKLQGFGGSGQ